MQVPNVNAQPVSALLAMFGWKTTQPPDVARLNRWAQQWRSDWQGPEFVLDCDSQLADRYYEVFIAEEHKVPTRADNWHDTYNALMWLLFPRTKQLINGLHCNEIETFGVHPRTPRRNRLTHFDECGVVIAVPENTLVQANQLLTLLASHCWEQAFFDKQKMWGKQLYPVIFGHALYEMLMAPFIGLTGKWLAVVVPESFGAETLLRQYEMLDIALADRILMFDGLVDKRTLKPLPLLGIPGWYPEQSVNFYRNTEYFRPLSQEATATNQLPLTKSY